MGKLLIIPRRGTRDNVKPSRREEKVTVIGDAGANTMCASGATSAIINNIAFNHYPCIITRNSSIGTVRSTSLIDELVPKICAWEKCSVSINADAKKSIDSETGAFNDFACRKYRQAQTNVIGRIRLRRNTWHAADGISKSKNDIEIVRSVDVEDNIDTFVRLGHNLSDNDIDQNSIINAPDVFLEHWPYARITGDESTCCTSDAASFNKRKIQDCITVANCNTSNRRVVKRQNRRSVMLTRSRSIAVPDDIVPVTVVERFDDTIDTITNVTRERENRRNCFVHDLIDTIHVTRHEHRNVECTDVDNSNVRSSITISTTRGTIDSSFLLNTQCQRILADTNLTVDIASSHRRHEPSNRRLIEIDIVDSSYQTYTLPEKNDTISAATSSGFFSTVRVPTKINLNDSRAKRIKTDIYYGLSSSSSSIGMICRALLLGLLTMNLLCDSVMGAPSMSNNLATVVLEDSPRNEKSLMSGSILGEDERQILRESIMQDLGIKKIPDSTKANVSRTEYERAHKFYIEAIQKSSKNKEAGIKMEFRSYEHLDKILLEKGHFNFKFNVNNSVLDGCNENFSNCLYFPIELPSKQEESTRDIAINHATLRFLLEGNKQGSLNTQIKISQRLSTNTLISNSQMEKIMLTDPTESRWLEFDLTDIVSHWFQRKSENLGLEIFFFYNGNVVPRKISETRLNIFTTSRPHTASRYRGKRSANYPREKKMPMHKSRRIICNGQNKKCCRQEMEVHFKDLKGFEFIVTPKFFDAGYCKGRCPPRYNPAHHHALLQGIIGKEDKRIPKPCCAPSKLDALPIVHFDENDHTKLKLFFMNNMTVRECACS